MHPILASWRRLAAYLVAWAPVAALLTFVVGAAQTAGWRAAVVLTAPMTILYAFVCLGAWFPCRAVPLETSRLPRIAGTHLAAALFSTALWFAVASAWAYVVAAGFQSAGVVFGASPGLDIIGARVELARRFANPVLFASGVLLFLLSSAVHYLLQAFESAREAERRALAMQLHAREAELKALRAQIDPHFLFNSLNSVAAMTSADPAGARRMCLLLAEFLRKTAALGAQERIPLGAELALADAFLSIEQVRFASRLTVERDVEPGCEALAVPPLVLQPLVENAVGHGIAHLVEGGAVRIVVRRLAGRLEVTIANPCDPARTPARGGGTGLTNVRERLRAAYGSDARLDVRDLGRAFEVRLVLPAAEVER